MLARATRELKNVDPRLGSVIERVGPCTMLPDRKGTHFDAIARSIVYQQLSGKAAATIHGRFIEQCGNGSSPTPEAILDHSTEQLRACGLSSAKAAALRDLAHHVVDGRLPIDSLGDMSDEEIASGLQEARDLGSASRSCVAIIAVLLFMALLICVFLTWAWFIR